MEKTYSKRILGIQFDFAISFKKVKRIEIPIPDWADDAHLRQGKIGEWGTPDGKTKFCYYKGSTPFFIDIPECRTSVEVYVTPLYNNDRSGYSKNRIAIIDLFN